MDKGWVKAILIKTMKLHFTKNHLRRDTIFKAQSPNDELMLLLVAKYDTNLCYSPDSVFAFNYCTVVKLIPTVQLSYWKEAVAVLCIRQKWHSVTGYLMWTLIGAVRAKRGVAGTLIPSTFDALLGKEWVGLWEAVQEDRNETFIIHTYPHPADCPVVHRSLKD